MDRSLCTLSSFECAAHLGKSYQCNTVSKSFQKNKEELNWSMFAAKAVLVERENRFSLEELWRTHYSLK